jgi:hypothetical protein
MKEITLKEACEILDKAEAVLVENREDEFSDRLQWVSLYELIDIENTDPCGEDSGGDCECGEFLFLYVGDNDDAYLNFPTAHNFKVKITPDGAMLLNDMRKISTKIKVLIARDLNA